ncbi:MAG: glycoside hydrolase family 3 C-terminal domain-containing protein [Propionibacteriaceae bacterium]|jgi:beta-glucosidase-like glycosyl hydrolase|nr:glycoside hydrolase family 3 C-terminal domain-containing protein [Propionibacteriaceae bacterium]
MTTFPVALDRVREDPHSLEEAVSDLLAELTEQEKLSLLDGDVPFWDGLADMLSNGYNYVPIEMGRIDRLGILGLRFSDGPRGVVMGASTAFPVSMARGATWDVDLEERVGLAIGREARAQGANFFGGVCVNLPRHPAWGRAQETYSEDPILLGEFGAALTRGVQRNVMAVVKHFALNSMENARFKVDVTVDEAALHEVFLPHFRRVIEEGVAGVMTSYNCVNGEWAGQNASLLQGVLRDEWGFQGVTVSDFIWGLRDATKSLHAGLDVEEPFAQQRAQHLPTDLATGRASWDDVDRAARRILRTQLAHYASRERDEPTEVVFSAEHRGLAREVAATSMVLLKNEPVDGTPLLPLSAESLGRIALIGRLADAENTGDHGSSDVHPPQVITPLRGLREALPGTVIVTVSEDDPIAAASAAAESDVAIVVVGYTAADEGEFIGSSVFAETALMATLPPVGDSPAGQALMANADQLMGANVSIVGSSGAGGDRESLRLREADVEIIRAVAEANPRTVVVIVTAGAVITEEWRDDVPAVLLSWYAGSEGGAALADVLRGTVDAAGRLPFSIPATENDLPFLDRDASAITYDKWFGQRLLDRNGHIAAFPLGFGLSYTDFALVAADVVSANSESIDIHVEVRNSGSRSGRHVVQVYGRPIDAGDDFPTRVLLGFSPLTVAAGESGTVSIQASTRPLQRWTDGGFHPACAAVGLEVSSYSGDPAAIIINIPFPASQS